MKTTHRIISAIAIALLLVTGSAMLWSRFPQIVKRPPDVQVFLTAAHRSGRLGALFLVVGLGWLVTSGLFQRRSRFIAFENPGGEVRVSVSAIADYLARIADEFPWVVSAKPVVVVRERRLWVDMQCRVKAGYPLPELSRGLQDRVRNSLAKALGLADIENVTVTVRSIVGDMTDAPASSPEPERALPSIYGGSEPLLREPATSENHDERPDRRRMPR